MNKVFGFFFFLILLCNTSGQTIGQVTGQAPPSNETNSEAKGLLKEGIELTGAGQLPQAVRALQEAIKLDPQYADAYAALGRAYFKMREWRMAVDYLHRAAALNAKQRQVKNASRPLSVASSRATNPNVNSAPAQQEQKVVTLKVSASVAPELPVPDTSSETRSAFNSRPPEVTMVPAPTAPLPQIETEAPLPPSEKPAGASTELSPKPEPTGVNVSMSAPAVEDSGPSAIPLKPSNEDLSLTKIYRVGPGDVLDVRINEVEPRQSTLFTVTSPGMLEHPLLPEPLNVSALTTEEIETKIEADLKKRALIEEPVVSVGVRDYASHTILVSGLVKDSGTKILRREAIPLYVVVADAQPLPQAAKVTVVRNEVNQMFEIDLTNGAEMNMLVRPGDVINLQPHQTQFLYVGGEVKAPGEKIFRRGLTLMQAIISAGGVTPKSKVAEIGRDDGRGFLVKTSFTLSDIQTGKTMDPLVKAGDRIMVLR